MSEPFAPFGGDPVPADLEAVRALLGLLAGTADAARVINQTVAGIALSADASVWSGESADAFRAKLSNLPELVGKVERSYGDAAEAVRSFLVTTEQVRGAADALVGSAWAVTDRSEAASYLDPAAPDAASRQAQAVQAVADMTAQVAGLRGDYVRVETALVDALGVAKAEGIAPDSFWHKLVVRVEEWSGRIGMVLAVIAVAAFVLVVVVVSAGTGLGVLFAIGAALQLLGPVFTATLVLAAAHLAVGADHKLQYGDDGSAPSWTALGVETAFLVVPFGAGKVAKSLAAAGREGRGLMAAGKPLARLSQGLTEIDEGAEWAAAKGRRPSATSDASPRTSSDVPPTTIVAPDQEMPPAIIDRGKFDYFFGKVDSSPHNTARSLQNADQLNGMGIYDTDAGRALLEEHLRVVANDPSNILRVYSNDYGTFQLRESLLFGPDGTPTKLETAWQVMESGALRLTTIIPFSAG